ncbi:hypothetical protein [Bartonella sp. 1-1C]|uniref:hypothetical protein n=1 Tax=Bartonella sp. 1-1C TaxID=515256 RepID=UPI000C059C30|nr:hypothetical protein [Bartonella sp. 1-1C]ATO57171.1 hypothetical protein B11Cv2_003890 [Bartonella sp. 1-1C]
MDYGLATMIVFFIVNVIMFFSGFYFYKMTETQKKETDEIMKNIIRRQEDLIEKYSTLYAKRKIIDDK